MGIIDRLITKITRSISTQDYMTIQLDITNACNLSCDHCYHSHHNNQGALSLDQWNEVLNQYEALLSKLKLKPDFVICGGEPLISPNLKPMIELIDKKFGRQSIYILTNGTVLSDSQIEFFQKFDIGFQISLDGPNPETHDLIRGRGSFNRSMKNLIRLKKAGFEVTVLSTLSKKTSENIEAFFDLGLKHDISAVNFTRFITKGAGEVRHLNGVDRPLLPLELKVAYERILKSSRESRIRTNTYGPLFQLIDPLLGGHGKFGSQGIIVDYRGNLKVSSRSGHILGNVLDDGLEKLFLKDELMRKLRAGEVRVCGDCPHSAVCGGDRNASYAATGSFLEVDPGCWIVEQNLSQTTGEEEYEEAI